MENDQKDGICPNCKEKITFPKYDRPHSKYCVGCLRGHLPALPKPCKICEKMTYYKNRVCLKCRNDEKSKN